MRSHGLQPTRLLHPRDFPGESTGVGCPSPSPVVCGDLNKTGIEKGRDTCVCAADSLLCTVETEITQSCPTLSDPMGCSPPGSSIHGVFQAKNTGVGCHCLLRPYNPALSLLGIYPEETKIEKDMYAKAHCSTIYNTWDMEAT